MLGASRIDLDAVEKRKISCPNRESNPGRRYTDWAVRILICADTM
jgi:hypothetical protein